MKSPKEMALERKLLAQLSEHPEARKVAELLTSDEEIQVMQDYANSVSIIRLGYNDHGPVHMRQVAKNAVMMMHLLKDAGIQGNLEKDKAGTFDESLAAVILASFLHDLGMAVGRQDHELFSATLSLPIITRILKQVYPDDIQKLVAVRSLALEGIVGHMANRKIHSIEAGIILVADGCDMEKGRARIPIALSTEPKMGDIHKYSANSIESVDITAGANKPIRIIVEMSAEVGFFQIEEVLFPKINSSPVKPYIELYAGVQGQEQKRYL
ncbi:MAG: phosphohydrolase [Sphaerochaetaceae bacterium]|jgi:metal-dependent HD superfamily phosphatase/phosphodiesterase|nr:phosphohydrolase [Sphaerochaetaceae bacterium]NLO61337.1 phosphohydrolase [Spirochaetales bacterium]